MPVMDIGHVSVLVFSAGMFVFVRVCNVSRVMFVEFIVPVPVLVQNRHVDMKMSVFLIRQ